MYFRAISDAIAHDLADGQKVVVLYGPRQVGKTTLIKALIQKSGRSFCSINADERKYTDVFSARDLNKMMGLIGNAKGLFIDEAQRIPDIGINIKILHDAHPELTIVLTGSSSFELASHVQEPLTGRTRSHSLFPISISELCHDFSPFELGEKTEEHLLYGMYPEVLTLKTTDQKQRHLKELATAYLYKDVLELVNLKKSEKLEDLLRLLAFQIGSQVSISELGRATELSKETVAHYLDLLEKSFVIFRLRGFSRNLRNEVTRMDKIYFVDVGIRNAILDQFSPLKKRNDVGALWENFLISERRKSRSYAGWPGRIFFWRLHSGSEIDYIEERADGLTGIEFKWRNKKSRASAAWKSAYPDAQFATVHSENFLKFLTEPDCPPEA